MSAALFQFKRAWYLCEAIFTCPGYHLILSFWAQKTDIDAAVYTWLCLTVWFWLEIIKSSGLPRLNSSRFNGMLRRSISHRILKRHLSKILVASRWRLIYTAQLLWMGLHLLLLISIYRTQIVIWINPMIRINTIMLLSLSRVNAFKFFMFPSRFLITLDRLL